MWQVIGQPKAVALLESSLKQGRLSHAYLFVGPARVGKMTLALNLARALNCEGEEQPCNQCRPCRRIAAGKHADVQIIGVASEENLAEGRPRTEIGIEQIKELQSSASLPAFEGKHKVFIIDGAEHLSIEAANCLLKTLEEPPPQVLLILLATKERTLLPTVVSRCHRLELPPMSVTTEEEALTHHWGVDPQKARLSARLSCGCLGWALAAESDDTIPSQRAERIATLVSFSTASQEERFTHAAQWAAQFTKNRELVQEMLRLWIGWWRDLLLVKAGCGASIINIDQEAVLFHQAEGYTLEQIKRTIDSLQQAQEQLDQNANPRLVLEVLMLSIPFGRKEE